jgi:hypothetical protein
LDQIWVQIVFRESGEGQQVCSGRVEVVVDGGELAGDIVQEPVELGVDGVGVGLVVHASAASP